MPVPVPVYKLGSSSAQIEIVQVSYFFLARCTSSPGGSGTEALAGTSGSVTVRVVCSSVPSGSIRIIRNSKSTHWYQI